MGLGKTLQAITLIHTLLANQNLTKVKRVLILMPVNVILNWDKEFKKWTRECQGYKLIVRFSESGKNIMDVLKDWYENGGVLLLGYEMFRGLVYMKGDKKADEMKKNQITKCKKYLLDPGPDLVVLDEGHVIKNSKSILFKLFVKKDKSAKLLQQRKRKHAPEEDQIIVKTRRRIILTGKLVFIIKYSYIVIYRYLFIPRYPFSNQIELLL